MKRSSAKICDDADKEYEALKKSMTSLKDVDPEFYEFLQKEDATLLDFGKDEEGIDEVSVSDDISNIDLDEDAISDDEAVPHAAEDSDEIGKEKITTGSSGKLLTVSMINMWEEKLLNDAPGFSVIKQVMSAFKAAVNETSSQSDLTSAYKLKDPKTFNEIVRLCFQNLFPAICKIIGLSYPTSYKKLALHNQSEKWHRLSKYVRQYLVDVIQLLKGVTEQSLVAVILRHIKLISAFYLCFPKTTFRLIKHLIEIWSTSDDEVNRVICFLCIHKLVITKPEELLDLVLKRMYGAFVKNSKFTSPLTWPMINFMQRCYIELSNVDISVAYHHSFIFIRQLSITLRAAIREPTKERIQAVYNWQFVHCLHLWSKFLCVLYSTEQLRPLIYPLTQVIIGTIRLNGAPKFYPLRFQCLRCLIRLSETCDVYVPVIPFLLEVLNTVDFNKKPKTSAIKSLDFTTALKFSNNQIDDKSFQDGLLDEFYELMLSYLVIYSHHLTFPELVLPVLKTCKRFLKTSKVPNHSKVIKNLVERIQENVKEIDERRLKATIDLKNKESVDQWLRLSKEKSSPLQNYYQKYSSLRKKEVLEEISGKTFLTKTEFPLITLKHKPVATDEDKKTFVKLFEDSDEDNAELVSLKKDHEDRKESDVKNGDAAPCLKKRKRSIAKSERKSVEDAKRCILDEINNDFIGDEIEELRLSDIDSDEKESNSDLQADGTYESDSTA